MAGVGNNVAKALSALGNKVTLLSLVGQDLAGTHVQTALAADGLDGTHVLATVPHTAQSVILYDPTGRRQIYTDLKDIQERAYPLARFEQLLPHCDLCVLCNINFSRALLQPARAAGKLIATDVHTIADLDDAYNGEFMRMAHVLFMSHERLPCSPEEWAAAILGRYGPEVLVIGLGDEGALLALRAEGVAGRFPALQTRPIVSTVGAGDALFSALVDGYFRTRDARYALQRAILFASHKIGAAGAAEGFLTAPELDQLLA